MYSAISKEYTSTIKDLRVENEEHKLALYAVLFLKDVENSLPSVLEEMDLYGDLTGYKLQFYKAEARNGGKLQKGFKKKYDIKWNQS